MRDIHTQQVIEHTLQWTTGWCYSTVAARAASAAAVAGGSAPESEGSAAKKRKLDE